MSFQPSLLDLSDEIGPSELGATVRRTTLDHGAWVDVRPGWMRGADALFEHLVAHVPWHAERRQMYERVVDVPRLLAFYDEDRPLPHPALDAARRALDAHYPDEPFRTVGLCLYRDGRDSVAWHGDTIGRGATHDTVVAIVSVGAPRAFLLRPRGGGDVLHYELGHGDLVVTGGSAQRTWEHAVPKTARPAGPRISVQYRWRDVR